MLRFWISLILLFAVVTTIGCEWSTGPEERRIPTPNIQQNDLDGNEFMLEEYQGDVVFLHFFAAWCEVCQSEAPEINALREHYEGDDVEIVGIVVESSDEQIESFMDDFDVTYRVLHDEDGRIWTTYYQQFGVRQGVPRTFIVRRDGWMGEIMQGAATSEQYVDAIERVRESTSEE